MIEYDPANIDFLLFEEEDETEAHVKDHMRRFEKEIFEKASLGKVKTSLDFTIDESELVDLYELCKELEKRDFEVKKSMKEIEGRTVKIRVSVSWAHQIPKSIRESFESS